MDTIAPGRTWQGLLAVTVVVGDVGDADGDDDDYGHGHAHDHDHDHRHDHDDDGDHVDHDDGVFSF